jgi:hypothetical protein
MYQEQGEIRTATGSCASTRVIVSSPIKYPQVPSLRTFAFSVNVSSLATFLSIVIVNSVELVNPQATFTPYLFASRNISEHELISTCVSY